jgi:hypothetical protein
MLQQLANLPDNELMARARKLKDEEAAGILLERYSHLLATVSLPSLNSYDNTPDEFFPTLLQRLFYSLQTQTIPKIGEWMQFFIKSQGSRTARNTFYFPSSASSDITRLEYKAEKADSNLLQKQQLTATMNAVFDQLDIADRELLEEFYLEQKTFAEIAAENGYTIEETRMRLKRCKQELASLTLANLEYAKSPKHEQNIIPGYTASGKQEQDVHPEYVKTEKQEHDINTGYTNYRQQEQAVSREYATFEKQKLDINPAYTAFRQQGQDINLEYVKSIKQEQDINLRYAKFGKQGQDIKDLQQGSLF